MRTLVIVAHPDDESISCGALIKTRVMARGEVFVLVVHGRSYDLAQAVPLPESEIDDFCSAQKVLGWQQHQLLMWHEAGTLPPGGDMYYTIPIEKVIEDFKPVEIVVPARDDLNSDHRHLARICEIALRPAVLLKSPSLRWVLEAQGADRGWSAVDCNYFVTHGAGVMHAKLEAVACYRRETRVSPHPRSQKVLTHLHALVGSRAGYDYAEGYRVLFMRE